MATGDIYKLVVEATWRSNIFQNTYNFRWKATGDPDPTMFTSLADDFKELWRPIQSSDLVWSEWRASQQWGSGMSVVENGCRREGGKIFQGTFTGTLAGGASGADVLPTQCAMVATLVTGIAGRRKRGRVYGFAFQEPAQSAGQWEASILSSQSSRWASIMSEYDNLGTSTQWMLGVWSERIASGCVPKVPPPGHVQVDDPSPSTAFTPVIDVTLRPTVYTQRRRVAGVGR